MIRRLLSLAAWPAQALGAAAWMWFDRSQEVSVLRQRLHRAERDHLHALRTIGEQATEIERMKDALCAALDAPGLTWDEALAAVRILRSATKAAAATTSVQEFAINRPPFTELRPVPADDLGDRPGFDLACPVTEQPCNRRTACDGARFCQAISRPPGTVLRAVDVWPDEPGASHVSDDLEDLVRPKEKP